MTSEKMTVKKTRMWSSKISPAGVKLHAVLTPASMSSLTSAVCSDALEEQKQQQLRQQRQLQTLKTLRHHHHRAGGSIACPLPRRPTNEEEQGLEKALRKAFSLSSSQASLFPSTGPIKTPTTLTETDYARFLLQKATKITTLTQNLTTLTSTLTTTQTILRHTTYRLEICQSDKDHLMEKLTQIFQAKEQCRIDLEGAESRYNETVERVKEEMENVKASLRLAVVGRGGGEEEEETKEEEEMMMTFGGDCSWEWGVGEGGLVCV
jgi:hypothetical protein